MAAIIGNSYSVVVTFTLKGQPQIDRIAYNLTEDEAQEIAAKFNTPLRHECGYAAAVVTESAAPFTTRQSWTA